MENFEKFSTYNGRENKDASMKFEISHRIIDEDFRSENISGSGIRDLAEAIENEGMEVLGMTSYGDLTSCQQSARASCFILSIDDEEFGEPNFDGFIDDHRGNLRILCHCGEKTE
jgi:arginine decarboxylase